MSFKKRLFKAQATQTAASWLLMWYIKLVYATSRKQRVIDPAAVPYMQGDENGIFAFWHGRMMIMLAFRPPKRRMHVLSTPHRDGQISSRTVRFFGNATIYGSSTHGGSGALREIVRVLKNGGNVSITPEGQRGPACVAEKGVVIMAKLSGKPIIPVTFASTRSKTFGSWDRFVLAFPFGRIVFCVGKPILVAREADSMAEEKARALVEQSMNALVDTADRMTHG